MCKNNGKGEIPGKEAEIVQGSIEFTDLGPAFEKRNGIKREEQEDTGQKKE